MVLTFGSGEEGQLGHGNTDHQIQPKVLFKIKY